MRPKDLVGDVSNDALSSRSDSSLRFATFENDSGGGTVQETILSVAECWQMLFCCTAIH